MEWSVIKENNISKTVITMKVNILIINLRLMENIFGIMVHIIKAILKMDFDKVKGFGDIIIKHI
jgi:hypothetical protein